MKELPPGVSDTPALVPDSQFEYRLVKEHTDNRVWIRVKDPNGSTEVDIGILVNSDGVSVDMYPSAEEYNLEAPPFAMWFVWSDFEEEPE